MQRKIINAYPRFKAFNDLAAVGDNVAAVRKGLEEGLQKGLQKGLREGREEGLEQGREETRLSIARKLFEAGTPVDVIVNCTGVDDGTIASFAHPE